MSDGWLSIHDVAERMGVRLTHRQAWEIGAALANRWESMMGSRPTKELRTKKQGVGSHCFAIYPPTWELVLEGAIRAADPRHSPQGRLGL